MLRILKSLLTIVAVMTIGVSATSAYFTSAQTVSGMSFATGTLKIADVSEGWTKTVSFQNLKAGDRIRKWVTLENTGTLDVDSLRVSAVNVVDNSGLLGQIKISAMGSVSGDPAYFTPDWTGGATVLPWFNNADILDNAYYRAPAGVIKSGERYTLIFDFTVPTTLGNELQGQSASFDMVFTAEQAH